jgi:DNA-binding HxlR family transcriptional regulator
MTKASQGGAANGGLSRSNAVRGGAACAIARTVNVLKDPWSFLILREALGGVTRFADFRTQLAIASDVLPDRLNSLVAAGVLRREQYQEAGRRARVSYHLTEAGADLKVVIGALQQWGDMHLPASCGPSIERRDHRTGGPIDVAFVDAEGRRVAVEDADFIRTPAYPGHSA